MLKKMLATWIAILLLLMPAMAEGRRLPDMGPLLGVQGEFYGTSGDEETYRFYVYETQMTIDRAAKVLVAYVEALRELGFTAKTLDTSGEPASLVRYMRLSDGDSKARLGLIVASGSAESLAKGGEGTLLFALEVPDSMEFVLGLGTALLVEGGTRCSECGGTGRCRYCGGSGRFDYGGGYETCVICDGSTICNLCDGEGSY